MERTNKHLTFRALTADGLVHQGRDVPVGMFGFCRKVYTVCHDEVIPVHRYVCKRPVSCIRCLGTEDYPHAIVTEEYEA